MSRQSATKKHKEGTRTVGREEKEEKRARKEQQKQGVSLELLLGGDHNRARKDAGQTHHIRLPKCIEKEHMGHCPWCFMVVSFDYGCNNHGFRKEELLKELPENWQGLRQHRVDSGSMRRMPDGYEAEIARSIGVNEIPGQRVHVEDEEQDVEGPVPPDLDFEVIAEEPDEEENAAPGQDQHLVADNMDARPGAMDLAPASVTAHAAEPAPNPGQVAKLSKNQLKAAKRKAIARPSSIVPTGGWQNVKASRKDNKNGLQ